MVSLRSLIRRFTTFFRTVIFEFTADQCLPRASGLAFASLLSLVPLSAVLFSLFSSLGSFGDLIAEAQAYIVKIFVPTRQDEIVESVRQFVENTRGLGVAGLLMFTATATLLLAAIQRTFDSVWGSASRKNSLRRFVTYLSVLVVGSFLLAMGLNLAGTLRGVVGAAFEEIQLASSFVFNVLPLVFVFLALFLMIKLVPSAKTAFTSSLFGAGVGAVLWWAAQVVFAFWTNQVIRLSVVYGSIASIPIFLIWLYVAWTIVLFALEVTYVHQYRPHNTATSRLLVHATPGSSLLTGLTAFFAIAEAFYRGADAPTLEEIARGSGLSNREVRRFLEALRHHRLILATGPHLTRYVPARSLERTPFTEVVEALYGAPSPTPHDQHASDIAVLAHEKLVAGATAVFKSMSVLDLLRESDPEGDPPDDRAEGA